jgi:nucleotide-binding universal stress UspA family protein
MNASVATTPIVVGVDGSSAGLRAVRWAAREAKRQGVPLSLVHSVPRLPRDPYPTAALYINDLRTAARADGAKFLAEADAAAAEVADGVKVTEVQHVGGPTEVLSRESAAARMVVIGATGRIGLADLMIGSTALGLPARSHAPVVIVRDRADGSPADSGPVVVAVSGSPLDEAPLEFAFEYASKSGAELIAVHSWSDATLPEFDRVAGGSDAWLKIVEREKRLLAEGLAGYAERYPDVVTQSVVVYDRPARALVDYSETAQLLVVGTRGRGPLTGAFLGSTSRAVGKLAQCPVAIVRQYD